jgi:hypothetical protein
MSASPENHDRVSDCFGEYFGSWSVAWNNFWFQPQNPATLGIMRILVGSIVFYSHLVWTIELTTFVGPDGLLPEEYRELLFGNSFAWSHLQWFSSPTALLTVHGLGLVVIAMFALGLWTRWTSVATALLVISYANRATGALFGLDQINAFLCLYLAIGNSGGAFSVDAWFASRRGAGQGSRADTSTQIATRLIQIHMCIVYLFAAIGKLQGDTWFNGEAVWGALASYEYQTLDMTWLGGHMWLVAITTLTALAWELFYAALVWPKLTRPVVLAIAIPVHLGIGLCMGMMTFGLIMLVGNLAFVDPSWISKIDRIVGRRPSQ